jgi:hypothetical protein
MAATPRDREGDHEVYCDHQTDQPEEKDLLSETLVILISIAAGFFMS